MADERDHRAPAIRTLQLAAELCGGVASLAARLGATEAELNAWIKGETRPPNEAFFAALDIVAAGPLGSNSAEIGRSQARADRMQASADRAQASADRIQQSADRAQKMADKTRSTEEAKSGMDEVQRIADRSKGKKTTS